MSYRYRLEDLLAWLHRYAPALTDAVAIGHRRIEHGLLSVGLKLHCVGDTSAFEPMLEGIGGRQAVVEVNLYRQAVASMCLVLPPVGNARAAVHLLEAMEKATGMQLYRNPQVQIQICSPGKLSRSRAAMLAIAFYLGSDQLRRYTLGQLATTFSEFNSPHKLERGRRLVLYDAGGDFDRNFEWWRRHHGSFVIDSQWPFDDARTDLLTGTSPLDIENVNLVATLLVHAQHGGYWAKLGNQFEREMRELLQRHLLDQLLYAPWIRTQELVEDGDEQFASALQELMEYALEDVMRLNRLGRYFWKKPEGPMGILGDMKQLLQKFRKALIDESERLHGGAST